MEDLTSVGNSTTGGGWLDTLTGLAGIGTQVYGAVKGTPASTAPVQKTALQSASNTSKYLLYGGIGLLVLIVVYLAFGRR